MSLPLSGVVFRVICTLALIQIILIGLAQGIGVLIGGEIVLVETRPNHETEFTFFDPYRGLTAPTFLRQFSIRDAVLAQNGRVIFNTSDDRSFIADFTLNQLTQVEANIAVRTARWSPDGTVVAAMLATSDPRSQIAVINLDGSYILIESSSQQPMDIEPMWSFSGEMITFYRFSTSEVIVANPRTGNIIAQREVTSSGSIGVLWYGETLYYYNNSQLFRWDIRHNQVEAMDEYPAEFQPNTDYSVIELPNEGIFIARIGSQELKRISFIDAETIYRRFFSPDGTMIAFAAYLTASDTSQVIVVDLVSGEPVYTLFLSGYRPMDDIIWTKGNALVLLGYPNSATDICIMDFDQQRHRCSQWNQRIDAAFLP
jgi:WD40 repeat protein